MLYIVPTPIGNLEDITFRALSVLKSVQLVLAEDTRVTKKLFSHFDIHTPLKSFHKFNEHKICGLFVEQMLSGSSIALVSDAGTPAISDPGYLLVRACIEKGIGVQCLPGATAFVPALVNSGYPINKFLFEGFLPVQKGRNKRLQELAELRYTFVIYESPVRLIKTLKQLSLYLGENRLACVCREISKIHEESRRGTLTSLIAFYSERSVKGEIVIVVSTINSDDE